MSVAIATMGMFIPAVGEGGGVIDNGSAPYAYGGGVHPGAYPPRKRLKISVKNVNSVNENVKIKVQISHD